jgi:[ribosomal protein S18]-alanine N-acetyltransferase
MIRPLTQFDLPLIYEIYCQALQNSKYPCGSVWSEKDFESEIEKAQGWVWVESKILAFVFLRSNPQAWEITQLAVDPQHWGRSLAEKLLADTLPKYPAPIWLEVHEANAAAIKVYERAGFKKVGRRARYYKDGGAALLYSKT